MANKIHASAIVEDGAILGNDVEIGPFCHVGPNVVLGNEVKLLSHAVIAGHTTIGARTRVFPFASLGHEPQDLKFMGEETTLTIGESCTIREGVTMNPGTAGDQGKTIIGNNCVFLANAHVAHDCVLGNNEAGRCGRLVYLWILWRFLFRRWNGSERHSLLNSVTENW